MGRILLAALDDAALDEYLERADLQVKTSRTLHTAEALRQNIAEIRHRAGSSSIRSWKWACARWRCR